MGKKEKTNQILFAVYLLMLTCYMVLAQLSTVMQAASEFAARRSWFYSLRGMLHAESYFPE